MRKLIVAAAVALIVSPAANGYWETRCIDFAMPPPPGVKRDNAIDFNEYGLAFAAARKPAIDCALDAHRVLHSKFVASQPETWKGFLAGAHLSLFLAAALELGGRQALPPYVDAVARDAIHEYEFGRAEHDQCGLEGDLWVKANSCMDDHATATSGLAWATAYMRLSGREWQSYRARAIESLKRTFSTTESVCIHDPDRYVPGETPCNATVEELGTGRTRIISLNHGNQTPAYGIGLMPSIAAAFIALEAASVPVNPLTELTADERKIIEYLWIEGQEHTDAFGNFHSDSCYNMNPSTRSLEKPWGCNDQQFVSGDPNDGGKGWWPMDAHGVTGYQARWYNLKKFYERYRFSTGDPNGYQFDEGIDTFDSTPHRFFGPGRRETFLVLGGSWISAIGRPALGGPYEFPVAIRSVALDGMFVGVRPDGSLLLRAGSDVIGGPEVFRIYGFDGGGLQSGERVLLRMADDRYVKEGARGLLVPVHLSGPTPDDLFLTIHKLRIESDGYAFDHGDFIADGDTFVLRAPSGHYLSVVAGGYVLATGREAESAERFVFHRLETWRGR